MKYTRFEYKGYRYTKLKFFILVPVLAVLLGMVISKFLIVPYVLKAGNKKAAQISTAPEPQYNKYEALKERIYYIAQAGVFASKGNADLVSNKIIKENLPVYINPENEYYRIVINAGIQRELVEKDITPYKTLGYNCIIKELKVSSFDLPLDLQTEDEYIVLNECMNCMGDMIDNCISLINQYKSKSIDFNKLSADILDMHNNYTGNINKLKGPGGQIENLSEIVKKSEYIESMLDEVTKMEDSLNFYNEFEKRILQCIYEYKNLIEYYKQEVLQ